MPLPAKSSNIELEMGARPDQTSQLRRRDPLRPRSALDEEMTAVLRNNAPDVAYPTFSRRVYEEAIKQFQRDSRLENIILTDAEGDRIFRHLFSRALREVRESQEA